MIRVVLGLFLWSVAPVYAEPIAIRSGEHPGFSRLVLTVPPEANWQVSESETGYVFDIPGWSEGFDTSAVFDFVPRRRLRELSSEPSRLNLQLDCDCLVIATRHRENFVIVDIADPIEPKESERAATVENPSLPVGGSTTIDLVAPSVSEVLESVTVTEVSDQTNDPDIAAVEDPEDPAAPLSLDRTELIEGFSRAAGLDLLSPADREEWSSFFDTENTDIDQPRTELAEPESVAEPEPMDLRAQDRIRIRSAVDLAVEQSEGPTPRRPASCIRDAEWALSTWGTDEPYSTQLQKARSVLVSDLDDVDARAALSFARLHLYFGLGAEARQAARVFGLSEKQAQIVRFLANTVDGRAPDGALLPTGAHECGPFQLFWSVHSEAYSSPLSDDETAEITALFFEFPPHLKKILGPQLIISLNRRGDDVSASVIATSINRAGSHPASEFAAVISDPTRSDRVSRLSTIANSGGENAPVALALYLEALAQENKTPSDSDILLAESYVAQLQGTAEASDLSRALVRGYALADRFDEAMDLLSGLSDEYAPTYTSYILLSVANSERPAAVVNAVLRMLEDDLFEITAQEETASVTARLINMGLPDLTAKVISKSPHREFLEADRIRLNIQLSQYEIAEAQLERFDGREKSNLELELALRRGETRSIPRRLVERSAENQDFIPAWISETYDLLPPDDIRRQAADMLQDESGVLNSERPLASATTQIERSMKSRDVITALLEATE
ncbi:MAG: hypothetical protein AAGA12_10635 [Pseudomonadota bacterium]